MGEIAISVLASAAVSGALFAALVFLWKTWVSERLKNAIKHEYDLALEANKAVLKAQSDKEVEILKAQLKAETDVATEKLKAELQRTATEHQIRFASLHEMIAETVADTYGKLRALYTAVGNYTKILETESDPPKAERRKVVADAMSAFHNYYGPRKLYIPKQTAAKIDAFNKKLFGITQDFMWNVEQGGDSRQSSVDTWGKVWKAMSEDVPALFSALEDDFQSLLGMPAPEKQQPPA